MRFVIEPNLKKPIRKLMSIFRDFILLCDLISSFNKIIKIKSQVNLKKKVS